MDQSKQINPDRQYTQTDPDRFEVKVVRLVQENEWLLPDKFETDCFIGGIAENEWLLPDKFETDCFIGGITENNWLLPDKFETDCFIGDIA